MSSYTTQAILRQRAAQDIAAGKEPTGTALEYYKSHKEQVDNVVADIKRNQNTSGNFTVSPNYNPADPTSGYNYYPGINNPPPPGTNISTPSGPMYALPPNDISSPSGSMITQSNFSTPSGPQYIPPSIIEQNTMVNVPDRYIKGTSSVPASAQNPPLQYAPYSSITQPKNPTIPESYLPQNYGVSSVPQSALPQPFTPSKSTGKPASRFQIVQGENGSYSIQAIPASFVATAGERVADRSGQIMEAYIKSPAIGAAKLAYLPNYGGAQPTVDFGQGSVFKTQGPLYKDKEVQTFALAAGTIGLSAAFPLVGAGIVAGSEVYTGAQFVKNPSPETATDFAVTSALFAVNAKSSYKLFKTKYQTSDYYLSKSLKPYTEKGTVFTKNQQGITVVEAKSGAVLPGKQTQLVQKPYDILESSSQPTPPIARPTKFEQSGKVLFDYANKQVTVELVPKSQPQPFEYRPSGQQSLLGYKEFWGVTPQQINPMLIKGGPGVTINLEYASPQPYPKYLIQEYPTTPQSNPYSTYAQDLIDEAPGAWKLFGGSKKAQISVGTTEVINPGEAFENFDALRSTRNIDPLKPAVTDYSPSSAYWTPSQKPIIGILPISTTLTTTTSSQYQPIESKSATAQSTGLSWASLSAVQQDTSNIFQQANISIQSSASATQQVTAQQQMTDQLLQPVQVTEPVQEIAQIFEPSRPSRPKEPERIIPPKEPILLRLKLPQKTKVKSSRFNVFVRRGGQFRKIAQASSEREAFNLGRINVQSTAAASFKVVPESSSTVAGRGFGGVTLPRSFYQSRKEPGVFIQKRGARISSPGEKREITYKGIFTNRSRRAKSNVFGRL